MLDSQVRLLVLLATPATCDKVVDWRYLDTFQYPPDPLVKRKGWVETGARLSNVVPPTVVVICFPVEIFDGLNRHA